MTNSEALQIIDSAVHDAKLLLMAEAPKRTLFLMRNIKIRKTPNGYEIFVDKSVFYMPYTEEEWVSPQWRGRANPNEGWFRMAVDLIAKLIATRLGTVAVRSG